jgi:uncharacterized protein (DUF2267 family)
MEDTQMSATGLEILDKSVQTTNIWLNEITDAIGPDRQFAWHVLGVVLRALRDRLPADDAAHLAAQLPLVIRGAYYEQYRPSIQPEVIRSRDEFVQRIAEGFRNVRPVDPEDAIKAVFATLSRHIQQGQLDKTRRALPEDIRRLWPEGIEGPPLPLHNRRSDSRTDRRPM